MKDVSMRDGMVLCRPLCLTYIILGNLCIFWEVPILYDQRIPFLQK